MGWPLDQRSAAGGGPDRLLRRKTLTLRPRLKRHRASATAAQRCRQRRAGSVPESDRTHSTAHRDDSSRPCPEHGGTTAPVVTNGKHARASQSRASGGHVSARDTTTTALLPAPPPSPPPPSVMGHPHILLPFLPAPPPTITTTFCHGAPAHIAFPPPCPPLPPSPSPSNMGSCTHHFPSSLPPSHHPHHLPTWAPAHLTSPPPCPPAARGRGAGRRGCCMALTVSPRAIPEK